MELTRSKIAYNLHISPHRVTIPYAEQSITFVFSSDLYRRKFLEKQEASREQISHSLTKRFGVEITADEIADFRLYIHTEKRGFLIIQDDEEIECRSRVTFAGAKMILTNSAE